MRKIDILCNFDCEGNRIYITLREEAYEYYGSHERTYNLKDYNGSTELYNKLLDDFDAEYDDEVAHGFNRLCMQIYDEKED